MFFLFAYLYPLGLFRDRKDILFRSRRLLLVGHDARPLGNALSLNDLQRDIPALFESFTEAR